jgi:hypothetical protein
MADRLYPLAEPVEGTSLAAVVDRFSTTAESLGRKLQRQRRRHDTISNCCGLLVVLYVLLLALAVLTLCIVGIVYLTRD